MVRCYRPRVDSTELAAREHANMITTLTHLGANVEGALVRRAGGVAILATGLQIILFNQVIVEGDEATPDALSAGVGAMRGRGEPFVMNLRVGTDDRFVGLMEQLGLVPLSEHPWLPGMALHPLPDGPAPIAAPDHEIRRVTDVAGLEDHIRTAVAGFDLPEAIIRPVMATDLLDTEAATVYVGYTDGEPVTTGLGFRSGDTIGVYNIATLPSARKRGYGAAMTARIAADGAAAGCDVAILQATAMGRPVYERLGYRTVVEYMGYVEPPTPG